MIFAHTFDITKDELKQSRIPDILEYRQRQGEREMAAYLKDTFNYKQLSYPNPEIDRYELKFVAFDYDKFVRFKREIKDYMILSSSMTEEERNNIKKMFENLESK